MVELFTILTVDCCGCKNREKIIEMWRIVLVITLNSVICEEIYTNTFSVTDQCINVCKDIQLPTLELENYEQVVCQRGCRFFNIIHFKDDLNQNTTIKECHLSCNESYILPKERDVCIKGCDVMAQKRQSEILTTFILLTEEDDSNSIVLAEPDLEILESDLFSDPSIKSQLEIGFNVDYKIPETKIRTMPIEFREDTFIVKSGTDSSGDWLDCASRNSGIPRWILLVAILSAVLVALWLSLSTDKKSTDEEVAEIDVSDEKLILVDDEIKENLCGPPPAYTHSVESEKV